MTTQTYFDAEFMRRLEGLHLIAKRLSERAPVGGRMSHALGDGLEFADHRAYTPGDDVRFFDWPYYARMEKLLVRLFHRHSENDVVVLLDTSASMSAGGAGKFDYVRRVAAALAYVTVGGGRRVTVQPFAETLGQPIRSARDRAKILPLLEFLDSLTPAGTTALDSCARNFSRRAKNVGTVILLSDLLDASDELSPALASLDSARRDVMVLHAIDPQDAAPAPVGVVHLKHAEADQSLCLHLTPALCERYAAAWREYCTGLEHACRARNAIYVPTPTDEPFERLILQTLRCAGVLRS
jgi:uncharacterized protein (DUF58 family)